MKLYSPKLNLLVFVIVIVTLSSSNIEASETEVAIDDYITIPEGYLYQFTREIEKDNTIITIEFQSSNILSFFITDYGETDKYILGEAIYAYHRVNDRSFYTSQYTMKYSGFYEFVFVNTGSETIYVDIYVTFEYPSSGFMGIGMIVLLLVLFAVVAVVIIVIIVKTQNRSRYTHHEPYGKTRLLGTNTRSGTESFNSDNYSGPIISTKEPIRSSKTDSQQASSKYYQTETNTNPKMKTDYNANAEFVYCANCGSKENNKIKFCTNCGSKF